MFSYAFYILRNSKQAPQNDVQYTSFYTSLSHFGVQNAILVDNLGEIAQYCDSEKFRATSVYLVGTYTTLERMGPLPIIPGFKGIVAFEPHVLGSGANTPSNSQSFSFKHIIDANLIFVTANIRELRRAVTWLAAGGTFSQNGDAIAAPSNQARVNHPHQLHNRRSPPTNFSVHHQNQNVMNNRRRPHTNNSQPMRLNNQNHQNNMQFMPNTTGYHHIQKQNYNNMRSVHRHDAMGTGSFHPNTFSHNSNMQYTGQTYEHYIPADYLSQGHNTRSNRSNQDFNNVEDLTDCLSNILSQYNHAQSATKPSSTASNQSQTDIVGGPSVELDINANLNRNRVHPKGLTGDLWRSAEATTEDSAECIEDDISSLLMLLSRVESM